MSGGGRGHSVQAFRAERVQLAHRTNSLGPYGPGRPISRLPHQPGRVTDNHVNSQVIRPRPNDAGTPDPSINSASMTAAGGGSRGPLEEILDEVRRGRDEQKKLREEIKKNGQILTKLQEEYRKLNEQLRQQMDTTFMVESSPYKVRKVCNFINVQKNIFTLLLCRMI